MSVPNSPLRVRAITYHDTGKPQFTYYDIPRPIGKNQVVVKVLYSALNQMDVRAASCAPAYRETVELGYGKDFMGIVEDLGETKTFSVGDKVCGMCLHFWGRGTLATHVLVDTARDAIMKVPEGLSDEESSAWPLALCTAYEAICKGKLDHSSSVCVLGGSTAVGLFVIQLAKNIFKARKVVATCSATSKELVRSMGADIIVDYKSEDVASTLAKMVEGKDEQRFTMIVDNVDDTTVSDNAHKLLKPKSEGSVFVNVAVSNKSDRKFANTGSVYYNTFISPFDCGPGFKLAPDWFKRGAVEITVDEVVTWEDYERVFEKQLNQRAHGKLILKVD